MGFGKLLGGIALGIGAVVAAPVVLPAAAAAAATVGTTAAAVGTAAAATVGTATAAVGTAAAGVATAVGSTAVGSAVTGAVTTAASAVAGSAVGSAAIGTLATVGSGVGAAAGTVGLTGVATAAGTSAGAAAVGAIATSGAIGAATAVDGLNKLSKASDIREFAEEKYDKARIDFNKIEKSTNDELEALGKKKISAWNDLGRFVETYNKITHIEDLPEELKLDKELHFDENGLANITVLAISLKDTLTGGAVSLTAGNLIGLATSTGFTSIATASTGTAIAGLHGAAATNASLAALGGGSLSAGGLGVAGGTIVANALTFAPAAAIGGIFLSNKGSKSLDDANALKRQVERLIKKMDEAKFELTRLGQLANSVELSLTNFSAIFNEKLTWLISKVEQETDFRKYSIDEQKMTFLTGQLATIVKDLTCAQLMTDEKETKVVDDNEIVDVINSCNKKWKTLNKKVA